MRNLIDAIVRNLRRRARFVAPIATAAILASCTATVTPGTYPGSPAVPVSVTVSNPIAGIAQMASADVQAGIAELIAAGAASTAAPLSLQDSLTCAYWLKGTAIPQAQQIMAGLTPTNGAVQGPYSLFIAGKIAYVGIKGLSSSVQGQFIDAFNHNCGAAVAGDVNAIDQLLLKVGISVVPIPGVSAITNFIPALP